MNEDLFYYFLILFNEIKKGTKVEKRFLKIK